MFYDSDEDDRQLLRVPHISQSAGRLVWREYDVEQGKMAPSTSTTKQVPHTAPIDPLAFIISMGFFLVCNLLVANA